MASAAQRNRWYSSNFLLFDLHRLFKAIFHRTDLCRRAFEFVKFDSFSSGKSSAGDVSRTRRKCQLLDQNANRGIAKRNSFFADILFNLNILRTKKAPDDLFCSQKKKTVVRKHFALLHCDACSGSAYSTLDTHDIDMCMAQRPLKIAQCHFA